MVQGTQSVTKQSEQDLKVTDSSGLNNTDSCKLESGFTGNKVHALSDKDNEIFEQVNSILYRDVSNTRKANELMQLIHTYGLQERLSEAEGFDTYRHYGKDYQESLDELNDYRGERILTLQQELNKGGEK